MCTITNAVCCVCSWNVPLPPDKNKKVTLFSRPYWDENACCIWLCTLSFWWEWHQHAIKRSLYYRTNGGSESRCFLKAFWIITLCFSHSRSVADRSQKCTANFTEGTGTYSSTEHTPNSRKPAFRVLYGESCSASILHTRLWINIWKLETAIKDLFF